MRGVAEINFVTVNRDPFGPQSAREISPIAEAMICVRMTHTTAIGASRGALVPPFGQKDMDDNPMPAPSVISVSDIAPVTNAPATTDAHEIADTEVSCA